MSELRRSGRQWQLSTEDGRAFDADRVIDASGRGSRLPHWLAELDVPRARAGADRRASGLRLPPLPGQRAAPAGDRCDDRRHPGHRPRGARTAGRERSLAGDRRRLRRPPADPRAGGVRSRIWPTYQTLQSPTLMPRLEPVSDVAVYRQTSNRRHRFGRVRGWPEGLLVVGDAACAFNPVYGQGITVAALQALLLRDKWRTPRLQRRLDGVADFCWTVATSEDLRQPTSAGQTEPRSTGARPLERGARPAGGDRRQTGPPHLRSHLPPDDLRRSCCSTPPCS